MLRRKFFSKTSSKPSRARGFSLVELMVALALSGVIALAAIASLVVARRGFTSVDATSQMRDNGRFATEMIQRIVVQSAYLDYVYAAATRAGGFSVTGAVSNPMPNITGVNNALAKITSTTNVLGLGTDFISRIGAAAGDSNCASASDTACANGSDVLVVRYQTSPAIPGAATSDGTMINCAGVADTSVPNASDDKLFSVFHVAKNAATSEPALMCSYFDKVANAWVTVPVVEGVESFQVLYGLDGALGNENTQFTSSNPDTVPDRWLNASQMIVGGLANSTATYSNWRMVRSVKIGLVLRGPVGSAAVSTGNIATICPLGYLLPNTLIPQSLVGEPTVTATDCFDPPAAGDSAATSKGSEFPRKGATITNDGRLRQSLTFNINLRNAQ